MKAPGNNDYRGLDGAAGSLDDPGRIGQAISQSRRHDCLAGMGAVGIEDLALSVKAGEPRPGQRIGKEAPPSADIDGGTVLEEVLPYLIVVAASQAPSEGVQAARPGDVPLGLESTSNRARSIVVGIVISKTDAAVDKDGLGTVLARPPQGDPFRRELGQRIIRGSALPQGEQRHRRNSRRVLKSRQEGGVLDRSLDENRVRTHLLQERRQGQRAGRRVVPDRDEMDTRSTPVQLGVQSALKPGRDLHRRRAHSHSSWEAFRKSRHWALEAARSRTTEST